MQYCHSGGITVQRSVTSGGGMVDESQLGWQLYLQGRDLGTHERLTVVRRVGHASAAAISALGVDARCRARGDIEIDGRRFACATVAADGDAVLIQGLDGDFLPATARALLGLEIALSQTPVSRLDARIGAWFGEDHASVTDVKPEDLASAVRQALGRRLYARDARGAVSAE